MHPETACGRTGLQGIYPVMSGNDTAQQLAGIRGTGQPPAAKPDATMVTTPGKPALNGPTPNAGASTTSVTAASEAKKTSDKPADTTQKPRDDAQLAEMKAQLAAMQMMIDKLAKDRE